MGWGKCVEGAALAALQRCERRWVVAGDEGAAKGGAAVTRKLRWHLPLCCKTREREEGGLVAEQKRAGPGVQVEPKFGCGEAIEK